MKEYENIVEDIKNKIINNKLVVGDKLPSIKEMTKIINWIFVRLIGPKL